MTEPWASTPNPHWLPPLARGEDGIWGIAGTGCAVGSVVALTSDDGTRTLLVRKAPRDAYAFSRLLVFPGGLVRSGPGVAWPGAWSAATPDRVRAEAGVALAGVSLRPAFELGPLVSSYVAKGATRYTLVLPLVGRMPAGAAGSNDPSITEAGWLPLPLPLDEMAPVNRIVAWHVMGGGPVPPSVADAIGEVAEWTRAAGITWRAGA